MLDEASADIKDDYPLDASKLSRRARRAIHWICANTVLELANEDARSILQLPSVGPKTFAELKGLLNSYGLCFRNEVFLPSRIIRQLGRRRSVTT